MRKLQISLTDESYEAVREVAYLGGVSISCVIDALIGEDLVHQKPDGAGGDRDAIGNEICM